jgi:hypothetical protein
MAKTTAVRARQAGVRGYVNVGRPTVWGNRYRVETYGRDAACYSYRAYLNLCWLSNPQRFWKRLSFRDAIMALQGRTLGCPGCTQEQIDAGLCHAAVLARFVDEKYPDEEAANA